MTKITSRQNNYAFIDGQNLYLGINLLGWKLDYKRFFVYLKEKYNVKKAYLFLGYIKEREDLCSWLLRKYARGKIRYLNASRDKLMQTKRRS